jgi:hypothetical protein
VAASRSKVERISRNLRRLAFVLTIIWIISAVAAIVWVEDEWQGTAPAYRYLTAVADVSTFLIAAVLAYVGGALVQAIARVRASMINAMVEVVEAREFGLLTPPEAEPERVD